MTDKDLNNLPDESLETGGEQMGEQIANTQDGLVENLSLNPVEKLLADLEETFGSSSTISEEFKGKNNEYRKISIIDKSLNPRSEPEIAITIQPDGTLNIHVNPYEDYEDFYFIAKKISPEQLSLELASIKEILKTGILPRDSILEKRKYEDYR